MLVSFCSAVKDIDSSYILSQFAVVGGSLMRKSIGLRILGCCVCIDTVSAPTADGYLKLCPCCKATAWFLSFWNHSSDE